MKRRRTPRAMRVAQIEDAALRLAVEGVTAERLSALYGLTLRRGQQVIKGLADRGKLVRDGRWQFGRGRTLKPICWVLPWQRRMNGNGSD